jgi:ABC-type multidrug transport system fused ATPase/permease subunit
VKTLIRLLSYVRPYWKVAGMSLGLVFVVSGLGVVQPLIVRWTIDTVIGTGEYNLLWVSAALAIGVALGRGVLVFCQRYSMEYTSVKAVFDLRNKIYNHLQQLSFSFYDSAQTGQLMSRMVLDVDTVQRFLGMGLIQLLNNILTFVSILIILLIMDWKLTLISMVPMPFLIHAVQQFSVKVRPMYWQVQDQMGRLTAMLQESITGVRVVKAFGREPFEMEKFDKENIEYMRRNIKSVRMAAFYGPYMNFLTGLGASIIIYYGGRLVIGGSLSLGSLVAFNNYLLQLMQPVRMLGVQISLMQRGLSSGDRLFDILDTKAEVVDKPDARPMPAITGLVEFDDVWFSYDKRTPVLEGVSFKVKKGQTIAVLGSTGSGKSTIINLLPRFYDVDKGSIKIDGIDIRDVKLDTLRKQIGIVTQETFLFSASIKENIMYGRPDASFEEVVDAARAAHIHEFIISLPQKYETMIGERGVGLSGGQKQRVAIARALLMDARIILLDESTSNVDVETEMRIQEAFQELLSDRTSFIIAQRLSTVRNADNIIVLDKGKIVEEGTHGALLALGGVYSKIYDMQFREQEKAIAVNQGGDLL